MDPQAATAAVQQPTTPPVNPQDMVTLTNKKTNQIKRIPRADLPQYGLPMDYQSQSDVYAKSVKDGNADLTSVPETYRGGAMAALNDMGYKKKTQKETDADSAKGELVKNAKAIQVVMGNKSKMSPDEYKTALESAVSSYTAAKSFAEGGKNLTANELAVLAGQTPRIQQNGPSIFDKANEFFTGQKFTPKGELADDEATVARKINIALKGLDPTYKDQAMPNLSSGKQEGSGQSVSSRLVSGAGKNIKDLATGAVDTAKTFAGDALSPGGLDYAMGHAGVNAVKGIANQAMDMAPVSFENGDMTKPSLDLGKTTNYAIDNPVNTAMTMLPFLKGMPKGVAAADEGGLGAEAVGVADATSANPVQKIIRNTADLVNGGGSKEYIARQAKNTNAIPQNQVLLEDGVLGHPTETGKIQASSKAMQKYGSQLGDIYKNSDKIFKSDELGKTLDSKLADMGYQPKAIQFIKNYVQQQGSFDLGSGDNLIPMEKAWQAAQKLEKNPPKMLKNPETGQAFKQLSLDTAKIIRNELGGKLPETKPLNARYSAHADYMENGLQDPQGMNPSAGGIVNGIVNMGKGAVNPMLQAGYNIAGAMPTMTR